MTIKRIVKNEVFVYLMDENIRLTEEELNDVVRGVVFWLDESLPAAISDSVSFAKK